MRYNLADSICYSLLHEFAKENKRNATDAEIRLWQCLRSNQLGRKFNRQHIIGQYIVDFVCLDCKLIIEVDGGYHAELEQMSCDENRTEYLQGLGFQVVRFSNEEVLSDLERVKTSILKAIEKLLESNER